MTGKEPFDPTSGMKRRYCLLDSQGMERFEFALIFTE
jgi:hypothetical protein